jgi:hypothetical protein
MPPVRHVLASMSIRHLEFSGFPYFEQGSGLDDSRVSADQVNPQEFQV